MSPQIILIGSDGNLTREGALLIAARVGCDPRSVATTYAGSRLERNSPVRARILRELAALGIAPRAPAIPVTPMAISSIGSPRA